MELAEALASKIRTQRDALNLSQLEAAALVGVSERTWQSWETGNVIPQPRHRRLLDAFLDGKLSEVA